jgi:hypothetical protein
LAFSFLEKIATLESPHHPIANRYRPSDFTATALNGAYPVLKLINLNQSSESAGIVYSYKKM